MSLARCVRCEKSYCVDAEEQTPCVYHPGQYRRWWSCCRDPLHHAPGCRTGAHKEDRTATALLDSIASTLGRREAECEGCEGDLLVLEGPEGQLCLARSKGDAGNALELTEPVSPDRRTPDPPEDARRGDGGNALETVLVPYLVGPFDSFASICMRERMTPEELMRVNGLARRHVRSGTTVLIWGQRSRGEQQAELHRQLVCQFRRITKCSAGEARYYLEESGWDVEAGLQHRVEDMSWERQMSPHASGGPVPAPPMDERLQVLAHALNPEHKEEEAAPPASGVSVGKSFARCAQAMGIRCVV